MRIDTFNSDDVYEVAENIYWVGFYDHKEGLHCNPYLIIDGDEAILLDPGSIPDFPVIMRKIIDLINPGQISTIVVSHQDPDVCGNLAVVEEIIGRDDLRVVAHSTTHRLIYHYGITSLEYAVDKHDYQLTLKSGRKLQFLFTPYLHSPGAIATYDGQTKSLFTSDIFGALSKEGSLYTDENFPHSMDSWHQAIMPSNLLLSTTLAVFEKMDIEQVLPQHGSIINRDEIPVAIKHLKNLPCGLDLLV